MRFAGLVGLFIVASAACVFACGAPQFTPSPHTSIPTVFVYEKGWEIPGLTGATVVKRYRDATGSDITVYRPSTTVEVSLEGFEVATDGKSIRFVPGYVQAVDRISEYRVQGRTYAYDVETVSLHKAEPPMWRQVVVSSQSREGKNSEQMSLGILGCGFTTLRYFDTDGDGIFESLEYVGFGFGAPSGNSAQCPTTPAWALRLLPNSAAAERCARELTERKLDKLNIPPELKNVFKYKPVLPRLASPTE